ncbi:MAG: hypothetical protein JXA82_14400 [Sedimentisphaerales bacterium]|nr:hypothetical protein [Sedimentisphaerales bacterium]
MVEDSLQPADNPSTDDEVMNEEQTVGQLQQSFKCGGCGAKMGFKPGTHSQNCPYCGHENPIPQSEEDIRELDFRAFLASQAEASDTEEIITIKCPSCAAETTTDPNITSQDCPFCGSPIVATAHSTRQIKPKSLLPFHVNRKQGWEQFRKWVAGLWFAPNDLRKMAQSEGKLTGIYVPYWTYDSDTTSFYRGQRGKHYWVTEHYTTHQNGKLVHKTRRVRKTRWWPASGTVWHSFDDVLVLASNTLPRHYTEKLEPWDLQNLVPYTDEYLSGFRAESYQIDLAQGFEYGQKIMDVKIRQLVRQDIGGDEQRIHSVRTQHDRITFKHLLLPIWISAYRYKNKVFRFLINGRTGEVQGERPWSFWKIALAVIGVAAIAAVIALVIIASQG